jgi:hypothetical protein
MKENNMEMMTITGTFLVMIIHIEENKHNTSQGRKHWPVVHFYLEALIYCF